MAKKLISGLFVSVFALAAMPAHALTASKQVELCAAALDAQELAAADDYNVKFVSTRGGGAKRVTVELSPKDGGEAMRAECRIKRGAVTDIALTQSGEVTLVALND